MLTGITSLVLWRHKDPLTHSTRRDGSWGAGVRGAGLNIHTPTLLSKISMSPSRGATGDPSLAPQEGGWLGKRREWEPADAPGCNGAGAAVAPGEEFLSVPYTRERQGPVVSGQRAPAANSASPSTWPYFPGLALRPHSRDHSGLGGEEPDFPWLTWAPRAQPRASVEKALPPQGWTLALYP